MAVALSCRFKQCILYGAAHPRDGKDTAMPCCSVGVVRKVFRPHERLFEQGALADQLHILRYGQVKLTASLPDGRSQGLRLAPRWSVLGVEALGVGAYPCGAEAVTDAQVCSFRYSDLVRAIENHPEVSVKLVGVLNEALRHSMTQVRDIGLLNALERVASFLLSTNEDETGLLVSRADMAEVLGLTVETVSRVLSRLRREGVIDVPASRRPIRILDEAQLIAMAGGAPGQTQLDCRA